MSVTHSEEKNILSIPSRKKTPTVLPRRPSALRSNYWKRLPPEFLGRMVVLYYVEGRSYLEIAAILNIPLGTVRSRLFRGRLAL